MFSLLLLYFSIWYSFRAPFGSNFTNIASYEMVVLVRMALTYPSLDFLKLWLLESLFCLVPFSRTMMKQPLSFLKFWWLCYSIGGYAYFFPLLSLNWIFLLSLSFFGFHFGFSFWQAPNLLLVVLSYQSTWYIIHSSYL